MYKIRKVKNKDMNKQSSNSKRLKNSTRGITLIALVITIIVLLILAGVTIATLTGDNGILTRANEAKEKTEEAKEDELRQLTALEAATHLEEYEYEDQSGEKITIPAQCAVSQVEGENTLENGLVMIDINGNSWVWIEVPKNITVYPNAGLNVTNFSNEECIKIYNDLKAYTTDYKTGFEEWTDLYYSECGIDSEKIYNDLKNSMIKSIYQNEGFWIGQYEVGSMTYVNVEDNGNRKPVIKEGAYPYNYVTCPQAQKIATTLGVGNKTSSLMFGIQWDLVMKFLESKSGKSIDELKVNSSSWGNYRDSNFDIVKGEYSIDNGNTYSEVDGIYTKLNGTPVITTTGATDRNSALNIYDLAGNMWEWTLENSTIDGEPHTLRAGNFYQNGDIRPVFYRFKATKLYSYWSIGFRTALW